MTKHEDTKHPRGPRALLDVAAELRDLQDYVHGQAVVSSADLERWERTLRSVAGQTRGLYADVGVLEAAAPELLAALESIVANFDNHATINPTDVGIARATIARARGDL